MQIATSADALERATYNVLLYCPKSPPWSMCLVVLTPEGVTFLTCDSYALAWSICPAELDNAVHFAAIRIERASLEELNARAKKDKKESILLTFDPGEGLGYQGEDPELDKLWDDVFIDSDSFDDEASSWDETILSAFRDLISERETDPLTRRVIVATEYVRKLGQLKKEDKHQAADFCFAGEDDEVLIKVGDVFRVVVRPIDRERHALALGEGAVW